MTARDELIDLVLGRVRQMAFQMVCMAAAEWVELDLSMAQVKVLFVLAQVEPATVTAIGERLGVGLSTASHLVDRLVQERLALRDEDPEDRRRALVRLSARGHELINRLHQGREEFMRRLLTRIDDDGLKALLTGSAALHGAAAAVAGEQAVRGLPDSARKWPGVASSGGSITGSWTP